MMPPYNHTQRSTIVKNKNVDIYFFLLIYTYTMNFCVD